MPYQNLPDGTRLHFVQHGDGHRNLLFIHGNLANTQWWEAVMAALPSAFTSIALDLPGSGNTPETGHRHTIDYLAQVVHTFVTARRLGRFTLIGHSMGGGVAQLYTLNHPEGVERLVLLDSIAADGLPLVRDRGIALAVRMQKEPAVLERAIRAAMPHCQDESLLQRLVAAAATASPQVFLEQPVTMHEANWLDRVHQICVPTLFLHGAEDDLVPKAGSERTASRIPHCVLKYLPGCGHSPNVEVPQLFVREMLAFLGA